jgi:hypothetical protein
MPHAPILEPLHEHVTVKTEPDHHSGSLLQHTTQGLHHTSQGQHHTPHHFPSSSSSGIGQEMKVKLENKSQQYLQQFHLLKQQHEQQILQQQQRNPVSFLPPCEGGLSKFEEDDMDGESTSRYCTTVILIITQRPKLSLTSF